MNSRKQWIPLIALMMMASDAKAQTLAMFPPDLLEIVLPGSQGVDLSYFEQGLTVAPGVYNVDIYINKQLLKRGTFDFRAHDGKLEPVLNKDVLSTWGVKIDEISSFVSLSEKDEIYPLSRYLSDVKVDFDAPNMRLDVQIPQAYLKSSFHDEYDVVASELWDDGITAGVLNYSLTASHHDNRQINQTTNQYVNLWMDGQFNFGAWRLLTTGTFSYSRGEYSGRASEDHDWDLWNTYLQRDVPDIRSTLKLGEINTESDLFDSFSMRGMALGSNEQMLPNADRSFMPTISGFANSFAQVFIKQNDRIIYQMNVSPGPWKLDQLPAFSNEGDLTVITREADGTERVEVVPFTSVPLMLREGQFRYDVNIGKYYRHGEESSDIVDPWFGQVTASYGLPWNVTLLGGVLFSQDYKAYALGSAFSLGRLGALSVDIVHSRLENDFGMSSKSLSGSAYRVRYEKSLMSSGTSINLANYRYLSKDYRSFADVHSSSDDAIFDTDQMKHRWQIALTQSLGDWGHLTANGNYISYHDSKRASKTFSATYTKNINGVGLRLSYSRLYEKTVNGWEPDEQIMLNVDVPLGRFIGERTSPMKHMHASYQASMDKQDGHRDYEHNVVLRYNNPDSDWYWRLSQAMGDRDARESSAMIGYDGDQTTASLSYSRSHTNNTFMLSSNGGVVIHDGGVTLSARSFDSIALVEVADVENVKINQSANVLTDSNGYAVVTSLRNYSANEIVIDPSTLPEGAFLASGTNQKIYPTTKSIVKVVYPVRLGRQALVYLSQADGKPLPFGTPVVLVENDAQTHEIMSFVGENGRTYFSGIPQEGMLLAKWKDMSGEHVEQFAYSLPDAEKANVEKDFVAIPQVFLKADQKE